MVTAREGITGGMTISDALREFEGRGYRERFSVREGGLVECGRCGAEIAPAEVRMESMRRMEGASDPADMVIIGALVCPRCDAHGTATLQYGPMAPPEHAVALRALADHRPSAELSRQAITGISGVRDSGWLPGPDDGDA